MSWEPGPAEHPFVWDTVPDGDDIVRWNPRTADTETDDRYLWPEDLPVKLGPHWDGAAGADPDAPTIEDTFADPENPTLDEVNNTYGLTQIVAECIRRRNLLEATRYGWSLSAAPAFWNPARITAAPHNTLKTFIDHVRDRELLTAFSYSYLPIVANTTYRRWHIGELRKALATDSLALRPNWDDYASVPLGPHTGLYRVGNSYPPVAGTSLQRSDLNGWRVGQLHPPSPSWRYQNYRRYDHYRIPADLPEMAGADITFSTYWSGSYRTWNLLLYRSNTFRGPIDTGDWGNLDVLEANCGQRPDTETRSTVALASALQPGEDHSLIWVSSRDVDGTAPDLDANETLHVRGPSEYPTTGNWYGPILRLKPA